MQPWNLDVLYTSFDDPQIQIDLNEIPIVISQMKEVLSKIEQEPSAELLITYMNKNNVLMDLFETLGNYGQLNYSVDTKNNKAMKLIESVEGLYPEMTLLEVAFKKSLLGISSLSNLLEDEKLAPYAFIINEALSSAKHMLTDKEENMLAQLKNTGSNAWSKLQDVAISSLMVNFEDEKVPITLIRSFAYDGSLEKRKKAYEAEIAAYDQIASTSAAALNAIKGQVWTEVKLRGYQHPLDMTLEQSRMDKETLDAMMTAIKEYLPVFRSYLKKKAQLLGHEGSLPFYDLFAPVGDGELTYSYQEAADFIVKQFSTFSDDLGDFAQKAFDSNWIDAKPREGKVAGAFCSNLHSKNESRIMANFNGSFNDMSTLAHELGHGYHGECLKGVPSSNSDYPMPLAETASIFCETIVSNAALKTAPDNVKLGIIENSVMSANQVITDIYSRYLFETALFEKRQASSLSVEELKEAMIEAQKASYGDGLDATKMHPFMWVCKPHYYSAEYNFYNFPYAFGLLFAKGLYAMYLEEGEAFVEKYKTLLKATGDHNIKDVLATVGVDAHNPDFFRNSLEIIKQEIDYILSVNPSL